MGSISFGEALVAGKKRVPKPATGKTALRTRCVVFIVGIFTTNRGRVRDKRVGFNPGV